jgi:hypothetical protein
MLRVQGDRHVVFAAGASVALSVAIAECTVMRDPG